MSFRKAKKASKKNEEMPMQHDRDNLLTEKGSFFITEAYKALRTNVTFSLADENACKVIVITSSMQSEGKSITAANLGISYAMADKKVLLIDCDLRRPKQSRLLDISSKVGLSNLLLNPSLEDQAVMKSGVNNLDVILCGTIPPNPSELLGSRQMEELLQRMREKYDIILLDTPPITMVSDALVLTPYSDGVLISVRLKHTDRGAISFSIDQLYRAKAKILGFVLNQVSIDQTSYGFAKKKSSSYRKYYNSYGRGYHNYGYGGYGYGGYGYGGYGYGGYGGYGYGGYGYGYGYGYGSRPDEGEKPKTEEEKADK